jgi:Rifampin ADP-ribosyl transferase
MPNTATVFAQQYFHGTRADIKPGQMISVGFNSNFGCGTPLSWVYFTSTMDAAIWGAELAAGCAPQRIYVVEPTGPIFDDPNLTDKKFPGNPSRSFRSRDPVRVIAEVIGWKGHAPEQVKQMKDGLAAMVANGTHVILD